MDNRKVWFVTGASKGLGLTLVKKLLENNYRVAATSRTIGALIQKIGQPSDVFLPLEMNLTDNENVKRAIESCVHHFGGIDVVVNNAGFGLIGTLEELSEAEVKANFDVNVFGSLNVIRHAAPFLRQQRSGYIVNIASIGGYSGGYPGFGIYCSSKFAVAGFSEGLAAEMMDFGVHVSVVYPGYFRTDFLSNGSIQTAARPIAAYVSARKIEHAHLHEIDGQQPNDPERAAEILINISELPHPPVHLFLGKDAYEVASHKIELIQNTMAEYAQIATSTTMIPA